MHDASLTDFNVHSTRGAGATAGLLMELPLDEIVSRAGWTRATTFIKYYMKPVRQHNDREPAFIPKSKITLTTKSVEKQLPDPHRFAQQVQKLTPKAKLCKDLITNNSSKPGTLSKPVPVYAPIIKTMPSCTVSKPESDDEADKLYIVEDETPTSPYAREEEPDPYDFDLELEKDKENALDNERKVLLAQSPHIEPSPVPEADVSIVSLTQSEISDLPVLVDDPVNISSTSTPSHNSSLSDKQSITTKTKIPLKKGTILIEKSFVMSQLAASSSEKQVKIPKQVSTKPVSTVSQGKSRNLRTPVAQTVQINPEVNSKSSVEALVKGGQPWVFEITSPTREPRNTSRPMLDNNKSPYWAFVDETE